MATVSGSSRRVTPRRRATMRDVAALAGVGLKTVSRVVNNEQNVSDAVRTRVDLAIAALDYQPNLAAGTLRRGDRKTLTLGLLLDSVDNPFSAALNRAVEEVASTRRTAVFAASLEDDPSRERSIVRAFTRRRVDGLILTTITHDHGYLQVEREQGTPIVFIDRPPVGLLVDAVVTDNVLAAKEATHHLLRHGHRRIAHLGDEMAISTAADRHRGFQEAMAEGPRHDHRGAHISELRCESEATEAVHRLMRLDPAPTALFTSQNNITLGALRALHQLGLQHSVALVGFDDIALADLLDPPVTVMAQEPTTMGTLAAERIFARLDGDESPATALVVPTRLIVRGSGEISPPET